MAHPGFGHLWQQAEMSDVDIVISVADGVTAHDQDHQANRHNVLQQFPGHSLILSLCPYLKVQLSQPQSSSHAVTAGSEADRSTKRQAKQQVTITLPNSCHEPAAMAVLSGLYMVKPWLKLLADLTPQQQVQAAVLADMWQLPAASEAAVEVLQAAGDSADRLAAVLEQLLGLEAVPDCLLPVFEHSWKALLRKFSELSAVPQSTRTLLEQVLLSKYGDLEAVWAPEGVSLQNYLMALPLYAMELLLASDKLKVSSEATVLFTAQAYCDTPPLRRYLIPQQSMDRLALQVRCPHLSQVWLSASVLGLSAGKPLLHELLPQLRKLLLLKQADSTDQHISAEEVKEHVAEAPASWLLPVRDIQPVSSREFEWEIDVAAIRQKAQDSASQKQTQFQWSPTSCLLGGIKWSMQLQFRWDASKQGVRIGLWARARNLPGGSLYRCTYNLECVGLNAVRKIGGRRKLFSNQGWGGGDLFGVGYMSGGFDERVWAAKGLPTSGSILLRMTVSGLGV